MLSLPEEKKREREEWSLRKERRRAIGVPSSSYLACRGDSESQRALGCVACWYWLCAARIECSVLCLI